MTVRNMLTDADKFQVVPNIDSQLNVELNMAT